MLERKSMVPYLCLIFSCWNTELFVEIQPISHSLLLVLQSTGHPQPLCHLCQPLGRVSEPLGDEKYFLVMRVRWFLSPGCKSWIHTAHCPGSFYQQDRFFLKLPSWTAGNLPDTAVCTLCIHGTSAAHFLQHINNQHGRKTNSKLVHTSNSAFFCTEDEGWGLRLPERISLSLVFSARG